MPASQTLSSWGNVFAADQAVFRMGSRHDSFPDIAPSATILPYGNGRSYGDSCLNLGEAVLSTRSLDRFIEFDRDRGTLMCESGVLLAEILQLIVPHGWFVPVTPGTCFVTVGGAIANDVHGKNHHLAGSFARHVSRFELLRSTGERLVCSQELHSDWFAATAGGLGLTGLITWAEIQLRRIPGPLMEVESIRFGSLDEFVALAAESDRDFEYTVAWIDCLGKGKHVGRGLFQRANHAELTGAGVKSARHFAVPFTPPVSLVNQASLRLFNTAYYYQQLRRRRRSVKPFDSFFYPLDHVTDLNRIYGPRGLYQYQCVIPTEAGREATQALLDTIARDGQGSFLAVLKMFGGLPSPGMLSFPRAGLTLALDFPNRGERLERLFRELDAIVQSAGGRLYPAKDGRMPGKLFRTGYPRWTQFRQFIDPRCSSSFWRRVMEES